MERVKLLEEEQEMLNSSLIALTTHFAQVRRSKQLALQLSSHTCTSVNEICAQVQFRLRQIVDAPTSEKETLLKELEEFAFRGIPDVPNSLLLESRSITPISPISCDVSH